MKPVRVDLVVAACKSNQGIGVNGTLPWKIPGDMAFFKKITTETKEAGKQNAVIMGRKTWESIPAKFRPLPGRLNIVISTTLKNLPSGVHMATSFEEAMKLLSSSDLEDCLETSFVIGGASLYKAAMDSPYCNHIYLTEVLKDFVCDTFLEEIDDKAYRLVELPGISSEIQTDGDVSYRFKVYQKV